jgi:hypothetical protein
MVKNSLTVGEMESFIADGVALRRDQVGASLTGPAVSLIMDWMSNEMDSTQVGSYTQRTFAPEIESSPVLLDLFYSSGVSELVSSIVGNIEPVERVQVQIRLPEVMGLNQAAKAMHVDGVACPHLDPNELRTFTLIAGVALSDVSSANAGALHYVPGGHVTMSNWFKEEWSLGVTSQVPPEVDRSSGVPFLGKIGDVILMHHLVPHSVGLNASDLVRLMAYFRISHRAHFGQRLEALRDPWLEFEPLTSLLGVPASRASE